MRTGARFALAVAFLALFLVPAVVVGQDKSLALQVPFPRDLFLVRARITEVASEGKNPQAATLVIEHVYAGPDKLRGKTFAASISTPRMGSQLGPDPNRYLWNLEKNVEGLWWLRYNVQPPPQIGLDGKWPQVSFDPNRLVPVLDHATLKAFKIEQFPYQKNRFGGDYAEGLTWADAVEEVYRARSAEERGARLEKLVALARPPISDWATALLLYRVAPLRPVWGGKFEYTLSPEQLQPLRRQTEDKNLSIPSLITLDRLLAQLDPSDWSRSSVRAKLLRHCLGTRNVDHFGGACLRLLDALKAKEMELDFYIQVLDPVLKQGEKLPEAKQWWLGRTLREPRWETGQMPFLNSSVRAGLMTAHYNWLKTHLEKTRSPILRAHAAAGFKVVGSIAPEEAKTLRELCATDLVARRELDYALNVRVWQQDEGTARRTAHCFGAEIHAQNGPYHVALPFYTGGHPSARGQKWELPVVERLVDLQMKLPVWFRGTLSDQVTRAKLWDLRAALTPDPMLRLLAEKMTNDRSLLYVVHLFQPGKEEMPLLIRVENGTGRVVGFLGALEPQRNPQEKLLRATASRFIQAHNTRDRESLKPLLGLSWCYGGYNTYQMTGNSRPYPAEADIHPHGRPPQPIRGRRSGGPDLPGVLPTNITSSVRYEDQRRALHISVRGLQALDKLMGREGYVLFLGTRPQESATLLLTVERGQAKVVGTLVGLQ